MFMPSGLYESVTLQRLVSSCLSQLYSLSVFARRIEKGMLEVPTRRVLADPILTAIHDDCLTGDKGGIVAC